MEIGVRELRNQTSAVIAAVRSGERVVLTVRGERVANIVSHVQRTRWLAGPQLREEPARSSANPELTTELAELVRPECHRKEPAGSVSHDFAARAP